VLSSLSDWTPSIRTNEELSKSLAEDSQFSTAVLTWEEQRSIIRAALDALPAQSPLAVEIRREWGLIEGTNGNVNETESTGHLDGNDDHPGYAYREVPVGMHQSSLQCGDFSIQFGTADGAITSLTTESSTTGNRVVWADSTHPLARVWYHGLDHAYIHKYAKDYVAGPSDIIPGIAGENLGECSKGTSSSRV
jgi:hypothetical protein